MPPPIAQGCLLRRSSFSLRIFRLLLHYIDMEHISDHDLERYHLGMVVEEVEMATLEEHLLACPECADLAESVAEYVDIVRVAIVTENLDL